MDGPRDYNTKSSKSDRERQMPYDITYIWNLKYNTNISTKQKQTHGHREHTGSYQEKGGWGREGLGVWDK